MREKIQKWEEEIEGILERQKEMNAKYNNTVRELRKKIQEAERELTLKNNELIAETVRAIYGEVNEENLESFRRLMISMKGQGTRPLSGEV